MGIVTKRDILKANLPLKVEFLRLFGVFYRIVHLQDTLNTLHGSKPLLYGINSLAKIFSRVNDVVKDNKVVYENGSRDNTASTQNETSSIPQNDGNSGGSQEFTHGVCQLLTAVDTRDKPPIFLIRSPKAGANLLLCTKSLDNAKPPERLLYLRHKGTPAILTLQALTLEFLTNKPHNIPCRRQYNYDEQSELPTE